jgi:hypothetical protein
VEPLSLGKLLHWMPNVNKSKQQREKVSQFQHKHEQATRADKSVFTVNAKAHWYISTLQTMRLYFYIEHGARCCGVVQELNEFACG